MPSRPSGADKEKERAQNEGSRGAGVSRRPLDRADRLSRRHGHSLVSAVNLADSGKVRVNRGLLVAESVVANQARGLGQKCCQILRPRRQRECGRYDLSAFSALPTFCSSLSALPLISGKSRLSFCSSCTIAPATTMRVNHLWSAGTTNHGASGRLVCRT